MKGVKARKILADIIALGDEPAPHFVPFTSPAKKDRNSVLFLLKIEAEVGDTASRQ